MTPYQNNILQILRQHWFWPLFVFAVVVESLGSPILLLEDAKTGELVILFDLCVFIPVVYFICYRSQQSLRQIGLRVVGLICLGICISSWIVPETLQTVLPSLTFGRNVGMIFVVAVEALAFIAIMKMVFAKNTKVADIAAKSGAPKFVVKLMVLEAKFWKGVWNFFNPRK